MIRSMTGYGRGEFASGERKFTAEIRSVNHRYNDITIKLPRGMAEFEDPVRKQLVKAITRGKTDVYIAFETFSRSDVTVKFNEPAADVLVERLAAMKERYNTTDGVSLNVLTRFQDILSVDRTSFAEETKEICLKCVAEAVGAALAGFTRMREEEGRSLAADIGAKLKNIEASLAAVTERAPLVPKLYREKLSQRIAELTAGANLNAAPDETRLATEVLYFADRACIDEELTRLKSHISQMNKFLSETEAVGRKLDFLAQEMNREINTIGSKANDAEISSAVVEIKAELEKIREQIQNIE